WHEFVESDARFALCIAPEMAGLNILTPPIAVLGEAQLFGQRARQERRRRRAAADPQAILRDLTTLGPGSPVVHEEYGVGRYVGLQVMQVAGQDGEFVVLEYAGGDKLYVPVQQFHLVSRYSAGARESAPPASPPVTPAPGREGAPPCRRASSNTRPSPTAFRSRKPPTRQSPSARS